MKLTLLFTCTVVLIAASGCLVDGGRHGREGHAVVIVPAPVVVVPVVRVHSD